MEKTFNFDVAKIRNDFPILAQKVNDKPLVYFDNGATTQKPKPVIDIINKMHCEYNSNVHRGIHYLSDQSTKMYEAAREKVRAYLNVRHSHEIIFTAGVTASINAVAFSFGEGFVKEGDEIIVSEMEHHSNIVPWQMMCDRKGAKLKVIPFDESGDLRLDEYERLFNSRTKLVSVVHVSNSLGTINPVKEMIAIAHGKNVPVLIDGAQAIQHQTVDVQDLDCDFYAFSGHKIYAPTGIGVLYGKERWLNEMPPYQGGGDMIDRVTFEHTTYSQLPTKFEAGTPNYIGAIGLGAALDYLTGIGLGNIQKYEKELVDYGMEKISGIKGLRLYGTPKNKSGVFSFALEGIHAYDIGMFLDKMGIAVRTGHFCTHPIWEHYKTDGAVRASLAFYNTVEEIDYLCGALEEAKEMLN
ncbi:MAG: cysteine desulfurase [Candidatus Paceibacterota bacterium]